MQLQIVEIESRSVKLSRNPITQTSLTYEKEINDNKFQRRINISNRWTRTPQKKQKQNPAPKLENENTPQ